MINALTSTMLVTGRMSVNTSPWARGIYLRARGRGCEHAHALRILARAWCRVIWTCWQKRVPYDPAKHVAAHQLDNLRVIDREAA